MATTIAHPRSIPSGRSGKTAAGFLVGVLVALAVGYGITSTTGTVDVAPSSALGADQVHLQRGAELAAQQAAALAQTGRMVAINENWGSFQSPMDSADLVIVQKAADYAALQARVAEGERMLDINEIGFGDAAASSAAQLESQIEYLTRQWKAQQLEPKTPGPVE